MRRSSTGVSIIELLIVLGIIGVLSGIGVALLPRQGMAVDRAGGVLASAIQFARFEAIKRNGEVRAELGAGATDIRIIRQADGAVLRTFPLDPQGSRVVLKGFDGSQDVTFNARGVATSLVARQVTLGVLGSDQWDRAFSVSAQGLVGEPS